MFEIWWHDRLIDVVPAVGEVPAGLTVKSRDAGVIDRVRGNTQEHDWRFAKYVAVALLAFTACVMMMTLTPLSEAGEGDGLFNGRSLTRLVLPVEPPKKVVKLTEKIKSASTKEIFASRDTAPKSSREKGKAKIASLLGMFDDTLGKLGRAGGPSLDSMMNNLTGGAANEALGPGTGNGPRGPGGPGFGGMGGPGGPLTGRPGGRPGGPGVGLSGKRETGPESGPIRISDGLARDLVAKVIRAHANEIKYCYERELQHTPGLGGKVSVAFTIGASGEVIEAAVAETTLENATVEDCMLARVRRWKFPEPSGGGTVDVNHPWIFRGAGDNEP